MSRLTALLIGALALSALVLVFFTAAVVDDMHREAAALQNRVTNIERALKLPRGP